MRLKELLKNLLDNYHAMRCCMLLKIHFLNLHLDHFVKFAGNLGSISNKQGEQMHQQLITMEKCYQG